MLNNEELIKKYQKKLKEIINKYDFDEEVRHIEADNLLIELLKELGFEKITNIYEKIDKWFA
jgi:hypothetical protein